MPNRDGRSQLNGRPYRATLRRGTAGLWPLVMAATLAASAPAAAVPPPPARTEVPLELVPNGPELVFGDTVRAYQAVPLTLVAQAGDRLLLRLSDGERVLVLHVEAPSGLPWLSGAQPGPDGLVLSLTETGVYRLLVVMSADAARAGRAASFDLRQRLRR